jgi:ADP-ribosylglycohydrolase
MGPAVLTWRAGHEVDDPDNGLIDRHDQKSQANGALMRISLLAIFGSQ